MVSSTGALAVYGTKIVEPTELEMWEASSREQRNTGICSMAFVVENPIIGPYLLRSGGSARHSKKAHSHETRVLLRSRCASRLVIDTLYDLRLSNRMKGCDFVLLL